MKLRLQSRMLIACISYYLLYSLPICAQSEQDCNGAIIMISPIDTFPYYSGEGILNEINPQLSSCLLAEENSVWFTFTMCDTGYCFFKIIPDTFDADYDWALYNLTNNTCADVFDTLLQNELRCNYSAIPGPTGLDTPYILISAGAGGPNMCAPLFTFAGQKLLLLVNNHDGDSLGFILSFSGTSLPCNYTGNISSREKETFNVYPNPSNGIIALKNLAVSNSCTLEILDVLGNIMYHEIIVGVNDHKISLNIAPGFYLLRVMEVNKLVAQSNLVIVR